MRSDYALMDIVLPPINARGFDLADYPLAPPAYESIHLYERTHLLDSPITAHSPHSFTHESPPPYESIPIPNIMLPRLALAVLALLTIAAATPAPIDPGLQPIIAYKNDIGLANPPKPDSNAASGRGLSGAGVVLAVGVVAAFL
ncbi:hypothetical protein K438DRAFT_1977919 [Mycena galopus ATCC 62051]|nr:hypothetical protein K438DRAFT_1977919 [Mycena galopus ATCC 62051]